MAYPPASWGSGTPVFVLSVGELVLSDPLCVSLFDFHECSLQQPGPSRRHSSNTTTELRCMSGAALGTGNPALLLPLPSEPPCPCPMTPSIPIEDKATGSMLCVFSISCLALRLQQGTLPTVHEERAEESMCWACPDLEAALRPPGPGCVALGYPPCSVFSALCSP